MSTPGTLGEDHVDLNETRSNLSPSAPAIPQRLGELELRQELGRGGMGLVFEAWDPRLDRRVAVKLIHPLAGADESERFAREAKAIAKLNHPGIVTVYAFDEGQGWPYLVLELVQGGTLKGRLVREGQLACREAALICERVARALDYAHSEGVLHRDVKPSNVLLNTEGGPLLTDFGLSRDMERASRLTHSGDLLGTPAYMSPEQAQGLKDLIGPQTDVYSLGATLYELLTGRPPFKAGTAIATLSRLLTQPPMPPTSLRSEIPAELEQICLRCLEKEPEARYSSAGELADALGRFLVGGKKLLEPAPAAVPTPVAPRRPTTEQLFMILAGGTLLSLLGAGLSLLSRPVPPEEEVAQQVEISPSLTPALPEPTRSAAPQPEEEAPERPAGSTWIRAREASSPAAPPAWRFDFLGVNAPEIQGDHLLLHRAIQAWLASRGDEETDQAFLLRALLVWEESFTQSLLVGRRSALLEEELGALSQALGALEPSEAPGSNPLHYWLGKMAAGLNKEKRGKAEHYWVRIAAALQGSPSVELRLLRGQALVLAGKYEEAEGVLGDRDFRAAGLRSHALRALALSHLARWEGRAGEVAEHWEDLRHGFLALGEALELAPKDLLSMRVVRRLCREVVVHASPDDDPPDFSSELAEREHPNGVEPVSLYLVAATVSLALARCEPPGGEDWGQHLAQAETQLRRAHQEGELLGQRRSREAEPRSVTPPERRARALWSREWHLTHAWLSLLRGAPNASDAVEKAIERLPQDHAERRALEQRRRR